MILRFSKYISLVVFFPDIHWKTYLQLLFLMLAWSYDLWANSPDSNDTTIFVSIQCFNWKGARIENHTYAHSSSYWQSLQKNFPLKICDNFKQGTFWHFLLWKSEPNPVLMVLCFCKGRGSIGDILTFSLVLCSKYDWSYFSHNAAW